MNKSEMLRNAGPVVELPMVKTTLFEADDRLSLLASELAREADRQVAYWTDVYAHEVMDILVRNCHSRVVEIIERHGYSDLDTALDAIADRTSGRWVYHSQLGALVNVADSVYMMRSGFRS